MDRVATLLDKKYLGAPLEAWLTALGVSLVVMLI